MESEFTEMMAKIGRILMNKIQMGLSYEQWNESLSYKEIVASYHNIKEQVENIAGDILTLNEEEMLDLGFMKWDEEGSLYLIPIWAYDLIPDGTELESIDGEKSIKGKDEIDLDVRYGCIAWGLKK